MLESFPVKNGPKFAPSAFSYSPRYTSRERKGDCLRNKTPVSTDANRPTGAQAATDSAPWGSSLVGAGRRQGKAGLLRDGRRRNRGLSGGRVQMVVYSGVALYTISFNPTKAVKEAALFQYS